MKVVLQRVSRASVSVDGAVVGAIDLGLLILVGVADGDSPSQAEALARKVAGLRIFADSEGRFNESLLDVGGAALVISQFTLHADVRKGRRPSFTSAARPELAEPLVEHFAESLRAQGVPVQTGEFGAMMSVELINDGPFTVVIDSADLERPRRG
ncbi:MAG: D-tyrosyl-tRNA(Tyr) deacylase [Chloroflexi bacterium]|nr:D-tyrosyl-tRNA(Tyr) deacylase [Chloroflexota bacterium]MYG90909.1 D-tyrosyl-tRNA(Tyr) deacylase [Chloroflexota bacterium]MYJ92977.1 D-tyrosyl-tRNA(Tyr) deacylase [Chloroflexota bacterium]